MALPFSSATSDFRLSPVPSVRENPGRSPQPNLDRIGERTVQARERGDKTAILGDVCVGWPDAQEWHVRALDRLADAHSRRARVDILGFFIGFRGPGL
jgi:hypothetical protein